MTEHRVYYKIGEASRQVGAPAHTLRYWEKEFAFLFSGRRDNRGHRLYTPADLRQFLRLQDLLYQQGYRMVAAKKVLRNNKAEASSAVLSTTLSLTPKQLLARLKKIDRLLDKISRE